MLTGRESREQLYVALTRGRHANHLHLAPGPADDDSAHPALTRAEARPADPLQLLRDVLGRSDQRPSATTAATQAADPNRRLAAAVERYLDAHTLHASSTSGPDRPPTVTGGPLPWLPPPPDPAAPGGAGLAEYLQRRADLVHALAAAITADQLPATGWAQRLRTADPDLARQLALWRAATGIANQALPLGPAASPPPAAAAQSQAQARPRLPAAPPARAPAPARARLPMHRLTSPPPTRPRCDGVRANQRGISR